MKNKTYIFIFILATILFVAISGTLSAQTSFKYGLKTDTIYLGNRVITADMFDSVPIDGYVTDGNFEKIFDKYLDKINTGFINITEKLNEPAQWGYNLIRRQQYVHAISLSGIFFVGLILFTIGIKGGIKSDWNSEASIICTMFGGMIFIIGFTLLFTDILPRLINPDYYAIKEIISYIK